MNSQCQNSVGEFNSAAFSAGREFSLSGNTPIISTVSVTRVHGASLRLKARCHGGIGPFCLRIDYRVTARGKAGESAWSGTRRSSVRIRPRRLEQTRTVVLSHMTFRLHEHAHGQLSVGFEQKDAGARRHGNRLQSDFEWVRLPPASLSGMVRWWRPSSGAGGFLISTRRGIVDSLPVFRTWFLNGRDQFRLAQWEEHQTGNLAVAGSNPVPTSKQSLAKTAGAIGLRCGAGGGSSFV